MRQGANTEETAGPLEVQRADPGYRLAAGLGTLVLAAVALVVLWVMRSQMHRLEALAESDLPAAVERAMWMVAAVAWSGALGFVGVGAWFWLLGRRIRRAGQYPPPGMKVLRDVAVRRGRKAIALANMAQAGALIVATGGLAAMWYLHRLAEALLRG